MPRIPRRWALIACLSAVLPTLAPGDGAGQLAERAWVTFRVTSAHHLAELRGDIASPVADAQTRGVWRFGLELRLRRAPGLTLQVADYVTDLEPFFGGNDLTPLHLLVVGVGLGTR